MSAYIDFYIKSKNNEFIPIGSYSRNSNVFQLFYKELHYGEVTPITADTLKKVKQQCIKEINILSETMDKEKEIMEQIANFNNSSEDKLELIIERMNSISDYGLIIKENNEVLTFIEHLEFLIAAALETRFNSEEHQYNADTFIYAGYEAGWPEEAKRE